MNLIDLNLAEEKILLQVKQATGLIEEKSLQLLQSGVYTEYGKIFEAYVQLINSKDQGLEALKRSLFIVWCQYSQLSCFTGIFELSEDAIREVFQTLDYRIQSGALDFELKWMLCYYDSITEYFFAQQMELPSIQKFLTKADYDSRPRLDSNNFINRGQLGKYWLSIISSEPKHSTKN